MAKMMQAASRSFFTVCGCSQCDKRGKLKRKNRRIQRAREAAAIRRGQY